jgi:hypothetical protein
MEEECEPSEFEEFEVVSAREWKENALISYYYVTLNNSVEYSISEGIFYQLEAGMIVYLTDCNTITLTIP